MKTNKIIYQYIKIFTAKQFSRKTELSTILKELSPSQQKIIEKFIELVELKQQIPELKYFYEKGYSQAANDKYVATFNKYLKEFENLSVLIKTFDQKNYGIFINCATKLLTKVKYENY